MKKLSEIELMLSTGDMQLAFNVNLNLHVLLSGDGENYMVHFIQENKVIKTQEIGFSNRLGYYSADDIAAQYPHLPAELLLYTKAE